MLVIPGGGYSIPAPSEGVIIAEKFLELGYNTFVLSYTVRLGENTKPLKKQPLHDAERAIRLLRSENDRFNIDPHKIAVIGFSAGGHLAASLAVHADEDGMPGGVSGRPDAAVLSYPVITSGKFTHQGTIDCLMGKNPTESELLWASLEKQVTKDTCPCFIWHTYADSLVPAENSLLFEKALAEAGITRELHIFATGHHGQSLATEYWKSGNYYADDVLSQFRAAIEWEAEQHDGSYSSNLFDLNKVSVDEAYDIQLKTVMPSADAQVNESLQIWPVLADNFLKSVFKD